MTREELSIEINWAGGWQEFYQTKYQNSTLEAHWTRIYQQLKKEYAELVKKEESEKFLQELKKI